MGSGAQPRCDARVGHQCVGDDGALYFLDANPNPEIAESEELAMAAKHVGIDYPELLTRVINLGIRRRLGSERRLVHP